MSDNDNDEQEIYLNPLTNRMVKKGTYAYRQMMRNLALQDRLGDVKKMPSDFKPTAKSEAIYKKTSDVKKIEPKTPKIKAKAELFVKADSSSDDESNSSDISCGSLFNGWDFKDSDDDEESGEKMEEKKPSMLFPEKESSDDDSYTYESFDLENGEFEYDYVSDDDDEN